MTPNVLKMNSNGLGWFIRQIETHLESFKILYDNTDLEDAHCMCIKKVKVSYSAKSFDIYDREEDAGKI